MKESNWTNESAPSVDPMRAKELSNALASLRIEPEDVAPRGARSRFGVLTVVVLAAVAVAAVGFVRVGQQSKGLLTPEVAVATIGFVPVTQASSLATATGYVTAERTAHVGAPREGRVTELLVAEGDVVKKGDVLARLEDWEERGHVATALARVRAARARREVEAAELSAQAQELRRDEQLASTSALSRATLEDAQAKARTLTQRATAASAELHTAEAELAALRELLVHTVIAAPISGTVTSKPLQPGEIVAPATTLLELVDFESLVIDAEVAEARLGLVQVGAPCEVVFDARPEQSYRGRVRRLGHRVDKSKATAVVKVELTEAVENVLPGMAARVTFRAPESSEQEQAKKDTLLVPARALVKRGNSQIVFVVEPAGGVREVEVRVGKSTSGGFELLSGVALGARVVLDPSRDLRSGTRVSERGKP